MSLQTPSKTGAVRDCCVEGRRRVTHRAEAARGWFTPRVPHGETSRRTALIGHVRFDERGCETERCRMAEATALILDSTEAVMAISARHSAKRCGLIALRAES